MSGARKCLEDWCRRWGSNPHEVRASRDFRSRCRVGVAAGRREERARPSVAGSLARPKQPRGRRPRTPREPKGTSAARGSKHHRRRRFGHAVLSEAARGPRACAWSRASVPAVRALRAASQASRTRPNRERAQFEHNFGRRGVVRETRQSRTPLHQWCRRGESNPHLGRIAGHATCQAFREGLSEAEKSGASAGRELSA